MRIHRSTSEPYEYRICAERPREETMVALIAADMDTPRIVVDGYFAFAVYDRHKAEILLLDGCSAVVGPDMLIASPLAEHVSTDGPNLVVGPRGLYLLGVASTTQQLLDQFVRTAEKHGGRAPDKVGA